MYRRLVVQKSSIGDLTIFLIMSYSPFKGKERVNTNFVYFILSPCYEHLYKKGNEE
jgi:hypothetical protein